MRYDYPLTPDSYIIEAGTYQGLWAFAMAAKYQCAIYTFEPIPEFFAMADQRLKRFPKVIVSNTGLANSNRQEIWHVKGDMTGRYNGDGREQPVELIDACAWIKFSIAVPPVVDLLAINCEGGEYELLEALIVCELIHRFKNIQVQFHGVGPDPVERRRGIQESLRKTHHLTYCADFIWENWAINA